MATSRHHHLAYAHPSEYSCLSYPTHPRDDEAIACYERHIADVVASVPKDKLLIFDVTQGWGPLCAFLDKPVPDGPFPRVDFTKNAEMQVLALLHCLQHSVDAPEGIFDSLRGSLWQPYLDRYFTR